MRRMRVAYNSAHMSNGSFIRVLIGAILVGGFLGAVVRLVPQFTVHADSGSRIIIDGIAVVIAGIVFVGYAKYVDWERKRSKRNS